MKPLYSERRLKKMALFLAKILEYDKVIRLKDWKGCPVFEPLYKDGSSCEGIPLMIIIRNGATSSLSEKETSEYLYSEYRIIAA